MRVLITDDDKTTCQLLATILRRQGMEAEWATDSQAGLAMSRRQHYDLFILDVYMPPPLGTEIAADLKRDDPTAKIILISAFADAALQKTATSLGVLLLSKPFTPDRLLETIRQALRQ